MTGCSTAAASSSKITPFGKTGARELYEFKKSLHERLIEAEREIVADVMQASDVEADAIEIEGRVHRRVLSSNQTHMTACGAVEVERSLDNDRTDPTAHALAALDLKLGIVEGFRTQRSAQQASWVVTQMTPKQAADLLKRVGNMEPSKASLNRLPRALGERWESERNRHEQALREAPIVPEGTRRRRFDRRRARAERWWPEAEHRARGRRVRGSHEQGACGLPRGRLRDPLILRREGRPARLGPLRTGRRAQEARPEGHAREKSRASAAPEGARGLLPHRARCARSAASRDRTGAREMAAPREVAKAGTHHLPPLGHRPSDQRAR